MLGYEPYQLTYRTIDVKYELEERNRKSQGGQSPRQQGRHYERLVDTNC